MKYFALVGLVLVVVGFALPARSGSVLEDFSANHVSLNTQSEADFTGAVTDTSGLVQDSATAAQLSLPHPPLRNDVAATAVKFPASGAAKDVAKGTGVVNLQFGSSTASDLLSFTFSSVGSALDAKDSTANPASANAKVSSRTQFFIDSGFGPTPKPPGTIVGALEFLGVPTPSPLESLALVFTDNGAMTALPTGSGPLFFPMTTGHSYKIEGVYGLHVPFGTDPQGSLNVSVKVRHLQPGDTNLDGVVDFTDLLVLAQHYGGPGTLMEGDVSQNGRINFDDLLILAQHYGEHLEDETPAAAPVPEPFAAAGFGVLLAAVIRPCVRRQVGGR